MSSRGVVVARDVSPRFCPYWVKTNVAPPPPLSSSLNALVAMTQWRVGPAFLNGQVLQSTRVVAESNSVVLYEIRVRDLQKVVDARRSVGREGMLSGVTNRWSPSTPVSDKGLESEVGGPASFPKFPKFCEGRDGDWYGWKTPLGWR